MKKTFPKRRRIICIFSVFISSKVFQELIFGNTNWNAFHEEITYFKQHAFKVKNELKMIFKKFHKLIVWSIRGQFEL